MYKKFENDILRMNAMYELPVVSSTDGTQMLDRLGKFVDILTEECREISEVAQLATIANDAETGAVARTALADLLGDLVVYCASEAVRWNIPLPQVLEIIMQSNFSKLGADGKPIKDERGKFLKGPNYWKPEPKILELLRAQNEENPAQGGEKIVEINMDNVAAKALEGFTGEGETK